MRPQVVDARPCPKCGKSDKVECKLFSVEPLEPENPELAVGPFSEGNVECRCSRCNKKWYPRPIGRSL